MIGKDISWRAKILFAIDRGVIRHHDLLEIAPKHEPESDAPGSQHRRCRGVRYLWQHVRGAFDWSRHQLWEERYVKRIVRQVVAPA